MNSDFSEFRGKFKTEQVELARKLHDTLFKIYPDYEAKLAWGGLGFKRGSDYSCLIAPYKDHLKLMIWRGVDLDDPDGRLEGKGTNTRHLKIFSEKDIDEKYLQKLLKQQFALFDSGVSWEG